MLNADNHLFLFSLPVQSSMISGASPMHISHPQPPRSLPPTAEEEQLMDMEEPGYQLIPKEEPGPVIYQVS